MSFRSLEYAIKEAFSAIRRNFFYSFASIITVALTLGVLGGFVLFALSLNNAAGIELNKFEISAWLDNSKTADDITGIQQQIKGMGHVASVQFVPADQTWDNIKKNWGNDEVVQNVDPKAVMSKLDYFRIRLDDPRYTKSTSVALRAMPHVEKVIDGREIVEQVSRAADLVKYTGIGLAGLFLLIAVFVISNTLRLMVSARRREIRIMQLVGASNWFIRLPMVLEGTILGIIGGAVACGLVLGGGHYVSRWALEQLPKLGQFSSGIEPLWLLGALVGLGWLIGAGASLISIQRFLKA
ncbi:MAG TPA: permease-like cell division protein FtsX [Armatimonadota bacterium]|jgi:cell division transport system permease protein